MIWPLTWAGLRDVKMWAWVEIARIGGGRLKTLKTLVVVPDQKSQNIAGPRQKTSKHWWRPTKKPQNTDEPEEFDLIRINMTRVVIDHIDSWLLPMNCNDMTPSSFSEISCFIHCVNPKTDKGLLTLKTVAFCWFVGYIILLWQGRVMLYPSYTAQWEYINMQIVCNTSYFILIVFSSGSIMRYDQNWICEGVG